MLGENLRKSREDKRLEIVKVAEVLKLDEVIIKKWESNELEPSMLMLKQLSELYGCDLGELVKDLSDSVKSEVVDRVDWNKAWNKTYPILNTYQNLEGISEYVMVIDHLYMEVKTRYQLNDVDTLLIIKDILASKYRKIK